MERGAAWEHEAVRDQWQAMAERRDADRFLPGSVATFAGLLLLLMAGAREACRFTIGGATSDCMNVIPPPSMLFLGVFGVLVLVLGVRFCPTATRG